MRKANAAVALVCGLGWACGVATAVAFFPLASVGYWFWLAVACVNGLVAGEALADAVYGEDV